MFQVLSTKKGIVYCPQFFRDEDIDLIPGSLVYDASNKPLCVEANLSNALEAKLVEFNLLPFIS